jgi:hypothetical protein
MAKTIGSFDLASLKVLRDDVTQYFWFEPDSSSAWGSGAHVTLYPESQFTDSTSPNYMKGQNIIMNTDGFSIRNGALPMMVLDNDSLDFNAVDTTFGTYTTMATFGLTGATIGQVSGAHSVIDADGQRFYASDGATQLANIGYGKGTAATGTDNAPYYTLGKRESTSNSYSSTRTYNVGDLCLHNDGNTRQLYVCIVAIQSPEAWNSTHWQNAIGNYSLVEGGGKLSSLNSVASGSSSHAEGRSTRALGYLSHTEGRDSMALAEGTHAEGYATTASGQYAHAEGEGTQATGASSHSQNYHTIASKRGQTALGAWNEEDISTTTTHKSGNASFGKYAVIVGNGSNSNDRSNALTVEWNGNVKAYGTVTDGSGNVLGAIKGLLSVVKYTHTFSDIASGSVLSWSESKTKTGYYPLGVVGFRTTRQALVTNRCDITNATNGSCTINMNARAVAAVQGNTAEMEVLWVKI